MYQGSDPNQLKSGPSKPPLNTQQPPLYSSNYNDINNNNQYSSQQQPFELAIIHIIPSSDNSTLNQFGCIILSSQLNEKESFSFNFSHHDNNSFESQSNSIFNALNQRVWIVADSYVQQMVENAFKSLGKESPQFISIMNATQIFDSYPSLNNGKVAINSRNARCGCNEIYQTLQRIALFNLLQQSLSNNFQSQSSPIDRQTDYISNDNLNTQPQTQPQSQSQSQQEILSKNTNEWTPQSNNNENEPINEYQTNYNTQPPQQQVTSPNVDDVTSLNEPPPSPPQQQQPPQFETTTQFDHPTKQEEIVQEQEQEQVQQQQYETNQYAQPSAINGYHQQQEMEQDVVPQSMDEQQKQPQNDENDENEQPEVETVETAQQINEVEAVKQSQPPQSVSSEEKVVVTTTTTTTTTTKSISPEQTERERPVNSSWAALAKHKSTATRSPPRRGFQVIHTVPDRMGKNRVSGGKYGTGASIRSTDGIRAYIADAIDKARIIWVSYEGHQKPFIPRAIRPIKWDSRSNKKDQSFFAIQHKSKSQNHQKFYLKNVCEVRDRQWRLSQSEYQSLMKRHNIKMQNQNNYSYQNFADNNDSYARGYNSRRSQNNQNTQNYQSSSAYNKQRRNRSSYNNDNNNNTNDQ